MLVRSAAWKPLKVPRTQMLSLAARCGSHPAAWSVMAMAITVATHCTTAALLVRLRSVEALGQYALALSLTAPIVIFGMMQLRTIQCTIDPHRYSLSKFLTHRLRMQIPILCAIGSVVWAYSNQEGGPAGIILLVGIAKAIDSVDDIFLGHLQRHGRWRPICILAGFKSVLFLTILITGLISGFDLQTVLMAGLFANTSAVVCSCFVARSVGPTGPFGVTSSRVSPVDDHKLLSAFSGRTLAAGLFALLMSAYALLPRLFLERYNGPAALGEFAAAAYVANAVTLLGGAIAAGYAAPIGAAVSASRSRLRKVVMKGSLVTITFTATAFVGAVLFGSHLLSLVYGDSVAQCGWIVIALLGISIIQNVTALLNVAIIAIERQVAQLVSTAVMFSIVLVVTPHLAARFGTVGAVLAIALIAGGQHLIAGYLLLTTRGNTKPSVSLPAERIAA